MNKSFKLISILSAFLFIAMLYLAGCVNYDQKTTLNADGSGTMKIHYWTSMKNFTMGTKLGNFDFDEKEAMKNYKGAGTADVKVKIEEKLDDSTKHAYVELSFKDINKIGDAPAFADVRPSWKEGKDVMELKYLLLKDTSAKDQSSDYTVTYTFTMPDEIISTNATKKDGKTLTWEYKLPDMAKDVEMTANVKGSAKKKTCGIFGMFLAVGIVGLSYYSQKKKRA